MKTPPTVKQQLEILADSLKGREVRAALMQASEPAITDAQILELAHRTCPRYTHSNDPAMCGYTFSTTHIVDFVRKIVGGGV